jgi:hypothetical protein
VILRWSHEAGGNTPTSLRDPAEYDAACDRARALAQAAADATVFTARLAADLECLVAEMRIRSTTDLPTAPGLWASLRQRLKNGAAT